MCLLCCLEVLALVTVHSASVGYCSHSWLMVLDCTPGIYAKDITDVEESPTIDVTFEGRGVSHIHHQLVREVSGP